MSSAVGRSDGMPEEPTTDTTTDSEPAPDHAAAPSDLPFRMSCQAAGQLGAQAANTVLSRIADTQPASIRVAFAGQCLSLGRGGGLFQFARRNDVATRFHLGGRAAARLKEFVCRQTVEQLAYEARKPGARNWTVSDPRRQELLQRTGTVATS